VISSGLIESDQPNLSTDLTIKSFKPSGALPLVFEVILESGYQSTPVGIDLKTNISVSAIRMGKSCPVATPLRSKGGR